MPKLIILPIIAKTACETEGLRPSWARGLEPVGRGPKLARYSTPNYFLQKSCAPFGRTATNRRLEESYGKAHLPTGTTSCHTARERCQAASPSWAVQHLRSQGWIWQQPSSQPFSSTSFLSSNGKLAESQEKNVSSLTSLEILWRKLKSRQHQCYRNSHKTLSQPTDMKPSLLSASLRDFSVKEAISRKESQVFTWNEGGQHRKQCHGKWLQLRKR